MGVCGSCETKTAASIAAAVAPASTAKLVLEDGRLQEFNEPVKVSEILRRIPASSPAAFFVCDADGMGMEELLSAVEAEEELKPGQLYFLLPLSMMRRPLRPQQMAELAVKASSAIIKSASGIAPLVFPADERREAAEEMGSGGRRVKRGKSMRRLRLELGVIPEYVEEGEEEEEEEY